MTSIQKQCKQFGSAIATENNKRVLYLWDFKLSIARRKQDMTAEEIKQNEKLKVSLRGK